MTENLKVRRRLQKPVIFAFLVVVVILVIWLIFVNIINDYSAETGNPVWSIVFNGGLLILVFTLPYLILKKGAQK